jgi:hypothetical protein
MCDLRLRDRARRAHEPNVTAIQSQIGNRKSQIPLFSPVRTPAAKKPFRHGAWLTEVVKQRRPETALSPCGKPSRAALGEPSPEIYSTTAPDSSAKVGDFRPQVALNATSRDICAIGSSRPRSLVRWQAGNEKRGGDRPWSPPALVRRAPPRFALNHRRGHARRQVPSNRPRIRRRPPRGWRQRSSFSACRTRRTARPSSR